MAPIARVRHFGGLASGMGVSSHTACGLGNPTFSLALVDLEAAVSSPAVEEFSNGKAAGGMSKSDLIDSSAPDWGVI